ncbi:MAG: GLPGLI family protein [Arachidicoccus sp.]|nr:GLPGLI family protein [Arachidicoccus sp.]
MHARIKTLIIYIILFYPIYLNAQTVIIGDMEYKIKNPRKLEGKAFYDFVYLKDTTQPQHLYKEIYELDFGKNESIFFSYSKKLSDSMMYADLNRQVQTATDPNHLNLTLRGNAFVSSDMYYTNFTDSSVGTLKSITSALFCVKDTTPGIDWQILDSTKNIQGYTCQKAVGESHGRIYTAWFSTDIPFSFGPRKLNGLPGLILQVFDAKRQVLYDIKKISIPSAGVIGIPNDAISATEEQYNKAMAAYRKNPAAFNSGLQGQSSGLKMNSPLNKITPTSIKSLSVVKESPYGNNVHLVENNPIDLK